MQPAVDVAVAKLAHALTLQTGAGVSLKSPSTTVVQSAERREAPHETDASTHRHTGQSNQVVMNSQEVVRCRAKNSSGSLRNLFHFIFFTLPFSQTQISPL